MSQLKEGGLKEFINFAKFQVSLEKKILFWDPVWDFYTDEQILIEYYAVLMDKSEEFKNECEKRFSGEFFEGTAYEEAVDWMEKEILKNQEKESNEFDLTPKDLEEKGA